MTKQSFCLILAIATLAFSTVVLLDVERLVPGSFGGIIPFAGTIATAGGVVCAVALTISIALSGAFVFIGVFAFLSAMTAAAAVIAVHSLVLVNSESVPTIAICLWEFVLLISVLLLSSHTARQSIRENSRFNSVRMFGLMLSTLGGTSFRGADLSGAAFTQACLARTNFSSSPLRRTKCTQVNWRGCRQLSRAHVGSTLLRDSRVQMLLTNPKSGKDQDFTDANFRGANLTNAMLQGSVLRRVILSEANLCGAILQDAILTESQAISTNFAGACFTGATLEAWNTDSKTVFKDVKCEYVYLLEQPKCRDDRERRPHDFNKVFQPGDFEKLFKEVQDDIQILIRNGVNPVALRSAFQKIREEYPDLPEDAFQGFQRRAEDILVTVRVPPEIDKSEFERHWDSGYQAGLKAGREESAALLASAEKRASSSEAIALALAQKPTPIQNTQNMTMRDRSQTIEIKGNVDRSVIGQGDDNHLTNKSQQTKEPGQ